MFSPQFFYCVFSIIRYNMKCNQQITRLPSHTLILIESAGEQWVWWPWNLHPPIPWRSIDPSTGLLVRQRKIGEAKPDGWILEQWTFFHLQVTNVLIVYIYIYLIFEYVWSLLDLLWGLFQPHGGKLRKSHPGARGSQHGPAPGCYWWEVKPTRRTMMTMTTTNNHNHKKPL